MESMEPSGIFRVHTWINLLMILGSLVEDVEWLVDGCGQIGDRFRAAFLSDSNDPVM